MKLRRIACIALAGVFAATGLIGCSSGNTSVDDSATIRIGTTDSSKEAWTAFEKKANDEGIKLDVVSFSDYATVNEALSQNQLDVNLFQHLKFLADYNVGSGQKLVPVGSSEIVPLALFWKDHNSLDGIEGQSVVLPNDPSNQGRAINVLVQAGLVKLRSSGLVNPSPADIDTDASKVTITPVDAAQSPAAYQEGRPAIINNSFLDRAGIDPKLAVFQDDPNSEEAEPYINVFVTKEKDADSKKIARLVELWHSKEVQEAVARDSKGTSIPVNRPASDLQTILNRLEESKKNS